MTTQDEVIVLHHFQHLWISVSRLWEPTRLHIAALGVAALKTSCRLVFLFQRQRDKSSVRWAVNENRGLVLTTELTCSPVIR